MRGRKVSALPELIRRDRDRTHLAALLLAGAESAPGDQADSSYFDTLRGRVHENRDG